MFVGVDPGKNGGIVELTKAGQVMKQYVIPLIEVKSKKKGKKTPDEIIHLDALCDLVNGLRGSRCFIEDIHALFGSAAGATFRMGENFGIIKAAFACNGIPFELVTPKNWQASLWIPSDMVQNLSSSGKSMVTDTKATSLNAAKRLFPDADFRYGMNEDSGGKKKIAKDGIVDAALIALYCKNFYETK